MGWKVPFTFEQGRDTLSNFGGLGVVGQILARLPFGKRLQASQVEGVEQPDILHQDVATAMMGLIAMKMPTYEDIESVRDDELFAMALGLETVPSAPTLRQRIDAAAASEATSGWADAFNEGSDHLLKQYGQMTPIVIGDHEYTARGSSLTVGCQCCGRLNPWLHNGFPIRWRAPKNEN